MHIKDREANLAPSCLSRRDHVDHVDKTMNDDARFSNSLKILQVIYVHALFPKLSKTATGRTIPVGCTCLHIKHRDPRQLAFSS